MPDEPYIPGFASESRFVDVRGLRLHVRIWGRPDAPPLVLLHGNLDASATFQFVVDALRDERYVVAPDWRGLGLSDRAPGYWFQDYLADLDGILEALLPGRPVALVGHSLGGNVACIYAGLRPSRVSHLVSLDGFGLPDRPASDAPAHLRRWLDAWREPPSSRTFATVRELAERLTAANPRLDLRRALFLAKHLSRPTPGGVTWAFDPRHRLPFAVLHRTAEWAACVGEITAPVLWIGSGNTFPAALDREPGGLESRVALAKAHFRRIPDTGHNLHHDAPDEVAGLIESFLRGNLAA